MSIDIPSFQPYEEPPIPSKAQSVAGAFLKGATREGGKEVRKIERFLEKTLNIPEEESGVIPEDTAESRLQELFPTRESALERGLERGGEIAPYAALGGGNLGLNVLRSLLAGQLGQTTEELGGGPLLQTISEIAAFGLPGLIKKLQPGKASKEIVDEARRLGLSEQEITPLIQPEFKQKTIGRLAEKGKIGESLQRSKQALQRTYSGLSEGGIAKKSLSKSAATNIDNRMSKIFEKLPIKAQQSIEPAYQRYLKSPKTGEDLIRFYKDINELYPSQKITGILKDPIKRALSSISPDLSRDFELTNNLYSKYYSIANRLKPGLENELLNAGEAGKLAYDVFTGNVGGLQKTLGIISGRQLASQFLINPRLQNLSSKFVSALNQNKPALARELFGKMISNIGNENSELAQKLRKIDLSEFEDIKTP